jgi:hypothetical protein
MTCNRNGGISIVITARVGDPTFSLRRQSDPMAEKGPAARATGLRLSGRQRSN